MNICGKGFLRVPLEVRKMVDKDLLNSKLQELDRYIRQLSKHRGITSDRLANDLDEAWIIFSER